MAALALILLDWVSDYIENYVKIWTTSWRTDTLCSCTQTENCVVHSNLIGYFNMHHNPFSTVQQIAWRSTCLQIQMRHCLSARFIFHKNVMSFYDSNYVRVLNFCCSKMKMEILYKGFQDSGPCCLCRVLIPLHQAQVHHCHMSPH
jgi:hypothetical protein